MAFAITPGAWFSLRASVADALALALAIAALALAHRQRWTGSVLCGVAAVLTKEVIIVVLAGWVLWKWLATKSRKALLLVVVPAADLGQHRVERDLAGHRDLVEVHAGRRTGGRPVADGHHGCWNAVSRAGHVRYPCPSAHPRGDRSVNGVGHQPCRPPWRPC
jgi:hypothetical protein